MKLVLITQALLLSLVAGNVVIRILPPSESVDSLGNENLGLILERVLNNRLQNDFHSFFESSSLSAPQPIFAVPLHQTFNEPSSEEDMSPSSNGFFSMLMDRIHSFRQPAVSWMSNPFHRFQNVEQELSNGPHMSFSMTIIRQRPSDEEMNSETNSVVPSEDIMPKEEEDTTKSLENLGNVPFLSVLNRIRNIVRARRISQEQTVLGHPCPKRSDMMDLPSMEEETSSEAQPVIQDENPAIAEEVPPPSLVTVPTVGIAVEEQTSSKSAEGVENNQDVEEHACKVDANRLCPTETASQSIFTVFQCLQTHLSDLTSQCKEKVEHSPVFNCAMDAMKLCSDMPQTSVPGCLRQHFQDLSETCVHQIIHHTPGQKDLETAASASDAAPAIPLLTPHGDSLGGKFLNLLNTTTVAKVVSILVFLSLLVICTAVVYLCSRRKRLRQGHIRLQMLQPPVITSV